ncbi:MAG: hypothetical protein QM765_10230 [Myxococcales bacterium]
MDRDLVRGLGHLAQVQVVALERLRGLAELLVALRDVEADDAVRLEPVGRLELLDRLAPAALLVELHALLEARLGLRRARVELARGGLAGEGGGGGEQQGSEGDEQRGSHGFSASG